MDPIFINASHQPTPDSPQISQRPSRTTRCGGGFCITCDGIFISARYIKPFGSDLIADLCHGVVRDFIDFDINDDFAEVFIYGFEYVLNQLQFTLGGLHDHDLGIFDGRCLPSGCDGIDDVARIAGLDIADVKRFDQHLLETSAHLRVVGKDNDGLAVNGRKTQFVEQ